MEDSNKLSRKVQVLFLSIGQFLTTIAALVSSIALSRLLSIDEYATYRQTILVYAFLTPILSLGFDKAIYYNFEKNKLNQGQQIVNIQYVMLSFGVLLALFFTLGGNGLISELFDNPKLETGLIIYSIFSVFNLPILLLQPVLVIQGKVKLLTVFNIVNKIFTVVVTVVVAFFYREANSILISILFVGILSFIVIEVLLIKSTSNVISLVPNKQIIKNYKRIGIPLVLASMMGVAGKNIDKLIISTMMSPEDFAVYSNGAMEIPLIGAITGAVMVVVLADFTKLLNEGKIKETFALWGKAVETTSSILIPIMFILLLNADWLIVAMYGEKYANSALPFSIYLLLLPMRTMIFSSIITASGETRLITKGAIIFLVSNVILSILLNYYVGFTGPAIATVISSYLLGVYFSYNISLKNGISFFKVFAVGKLMPFIMVGGVSLLLTTFIFNFIELSFVLNLIISNISLLVFMVIGTGFTGKISNYRDLLLILKK